jgi:hypothetical protein
LQPALQDDTVSLEIPLVELRIAQGPGKRPTMILVHGSGGIGANVPFWT